MSFMKCGGKQVTWKNNHRKAHDVFLPLWFSSTWQPAWLNLIISQVLVVKWSELIWAQGHGKYARRTSVFSSAKIIIFRAVNLAQASTVPVWQGLQALRGIFLAVRGLPACFWTCLVTHCPSLQDFEEYLTELWQLRLTWPLSPKEPDPGLGFTFYSCSWWFYPKWIATEVSE